MTHVTCKLTAKNRDQLRNLRSVIEYGLPFFTGYIEQTASPDASTIVDYIKCRASSAVSCQPARSVSEMRYLPHYHVINPRPAADGVTSHRPCPDYPSRLPAAACVYVFSGKHYLNSCSSSWWISPGTSSSRHP